MKFFLFPSKITLFLCVFKELTIFYPFQLSKNALKPLNAA